MNDQSEFSLLRGLETNQHRRDRQARIENAPTDIPGGLDDLLQQPRPVGAKRSPADVDGVPLVVDDIHPVCEKHDRQRATETSREKERGEETGEQYPEGVQREQRTERMKHDTQDPRVERCCE
ncbi:MAG: hypothetical protein AW07_02438 [Candidatus Accumulibacter sp. SK-11]|nr:MAG: hypothetical protein AW07_02438 [Candidatus Accumulibacter sp. SK-11]